VDVFGLYHQLIFKIFFNIVFTFNEIKLLILNKVIFGNLSLF